MPMPKSTHPTPQTEATSPPKPGFKKIDLGGITKKDAKAPKEYPVLPDPTGDVSKLVRDIVTEQEQLDALDGSLKTKKSELISITKQFFFNHLSGRSDIPSSVECRNCSSAVLVSFQNRYKVLPDEAPLIAAVGEESAARFFRQSFELKVDGDKALELAGDSIGDLISGLQELFAKHGATDALTAKSVIKPTKDYHIGRHTAFTPEQNEALERACPVIAAVKKKSDKSD